jgi:hypothetical protein
MMQRCNHNGCCRRGNCTHTTLAGAKALVSIAVATPPTNTIVASLAAVGLHVSADRCRGVVQHQWPALQSIQPLHSCPRFHSLAVK